MAKEKVNHDWSKFREAIKLMQQYRIGDIYYTIRENKITEVQIAEIEMKAQDHGLTHTTPRHISVKTEIKVLIRSYLYPITHSELFKTREEAAEVFLDKNNISKEVLKVSKLNKTGTTVGDLIDRLSIIDPAIDLEDRFRPVFDLITEPIINEIVPVTTSAFWDCECETRYIHAKTEQQCPKCGTLRADGADSRVSEIRLENIYIMED